MVQQVVVVGAGPAGLTAAFELARHGRTCVVVEADEVVGGISRTVERDGWRFDIGGHRFFTKVQRVEDFWHEVLPDEDFLLRPRMSRIFYNGKFFDYPLRAANALRNLGLMEAIACIGSYVLTRIFPPKDQTTFEGWVAGRFGWRLYRTFFKTYTEKIWGVPASQIQADWAVQRIKNLSLGTAILNSIMPKGRKSVKVTSLIEQFQYPKYGPGMLWEVCADQIRAAGSEIILNSGVLRIALDASGGLQVITVDGQVRKAEHVVSTMPVNALIEALNPPAPKSVLAAARRLKHRDFLTVALVVPIEFSFPDNWIYIHAEKVRVGRIQNFGSWSPYMVKEGRTCLGLEYFVNVGDDLWEMDDEDLVTFGIRELESLGIIDQGTVLGGYVVRMPKAYPIYDAEYSAALDEIRSFLVHDWPQIHPVGRNGMHRYNNQDHSMLTAMLTVDNLVFGTNHDVWEVNVESEYHETDSEAGVKGTGRSAPMLPARGQ